MEMLGLYTMLYTEDEPTINISPLLKSRLSLIKTVEIGKLGLDEIFSPHVVDLAAIEPIAEAVLDNLGGRDDNPCRR